MSKKQIGLLAVLAILCLCVLIGGGVAAYFMVGKPAKEAGPVVAEETAPPADKTEAGAEAPIEAEAGGSIEQAVEIPMGLHTGALTEGEEEHWYKFEVPHGHVLSLAFTPGEDVPGSLDVWLYNSDQKDIWSAQNVGPTVTKSGTRVMNTSSGGTYYVRVCDGEGRYSIELASQSQNDAGSGGDAGDELVQALEVGTGQTISGQLGDYDEEDWYKVEVPAGHILSLAFTPGEDVPGSLDVWLYNSDQKDIWSAQNVGPTVTKSYEMTEGVAGTHYIQVSDGQGSYSLEIK